MKKLVHNDSATAPARQDIGNSSQEKIGMEIRVSKFPVAKPKFTRDDP